VGLPVLTIWLGLAAAEARAGLTIGPGETAIDNQDHDFNLMVVDLNNPQVFAAGAYVAGPFNYQFSNILGTPAGTITPLILISNGGNSYTPVAVGAPVTYGGPTAFISTPFGGSDTFSLSAPTTVYAGLYWSDPGGSPFTDQMPVGFNDTIGSSLDLYSEPPGHGGANVPVVGTPISFGGTGGAEGIFTRTYDFSIGGTGVPEPSSFVLATIGALGMIGWLRLKARN